MSTLRAGAAERGSYEAGVTPFAPQAEAIIRRMAVALLQEVRELRLKAPTALACSAGYVQPTLKEIALA